MPQPQRRLAASAHRCSTHFSRVLSCAQHVLAELHSVAAQSSNAHSVREALTSVACDGSTATDHIGGRASATAAAGTLPRAHRCLPCFSRVLSRSQHVHHELHNTAAPSLPTLTASESRRSQASHAMAQSQLTIGAPSATAAQARNTRSPLLSTLLPRAQLQPARPLRAAQRGCTF